MDKTQQQKLIQIAEASGWKQREMWPEECSFYGCPAQLVWVPPKELDDYEVIQGPEYFNSLDAMQAAVLMQDEEFQRQFHFQLQLRCQSELCASLRAKLFHQLTFQDWQDAFCEVLNQRKEKK